MCRALDLNNDNKTRIDKYIDENPDSKLSASLPISMRGVKKVLNVYRLPIDMLFYNVRNGRFAAEYQELEKTEGGSLRPENQGDASKIKLMLLDLDKIETERTKADLKIRGQWNCGIITQDGYVVDGNRRMSIISKLYDETGLEQWKYLDVARLETTISPADLWKLEAGIQLGKDEIAKYGPVNELLKIREGTESGLTPKNIANSLYGYSEDEIESKLDLLKLIEQYLAFLGIPQQYSKVKNRVEHFINLQKIISQCKKRGYKNEKTLNIMNCAFQLIHEGVQHLELRKMHAMVTKDLTSAISEIEAAGSQLKPRNPQKPSAKEKIEKDTYDIMNEFEEKDSEMSQTYTHFINASDLLDVSNNEGKEVLLLGRAEKNLRPLLSRQSNQLPPEAISILKKIGKHVDELTKKFVG